MQTKLSRRKYTEEHYEYLREIVPGRSNKEICVLFKEKFGLDITVNNMDNLKSNAGVRSGVNTGRYSKGRTPENKGKKWHEFMSPEGQVNSRRTTFKKGDLPHNTNPAGTERLTKDGYIELRVDYPIADYGLNKRGHHQRKYYILKHRYVWEQAHGPVPKNHAIIFLDQNRQNCALENLALVSRSQLARLNQNHLLASNIDLNKKSIAVAELIAATHKKQRQRKEENRKWEMSPESKQKCSEARRKWWAERKGEK